MTWYLTKIAITTALIILISEISKRHAFIGAILASLPIISILAMIWLYIDTRNVAKVSTLSTGVFWLVLPSLVLFVLLPVLLKHGINFYLSLGIAIVATAACYFAMLAILSSFGVKL